MQQHNYSPAGTNSMSAPRLQLPLTTNLPYSYAPPNLSYQQSRPPPNQPLPLPQNTSHIAPPPPPCYFEGRFFPPTGFPPGFPPLNRPPPGFLPLNRPEPPPQSDFSFSQKQQQCIPQNAFPSHYLEQGFFPPPNIPPGFPSSRPPRQDFSQISHLPPNSGFSNSHVPGPFIKYAHHSDQAPIRQTEKVITSYDQIQSHRVDFSSSRLSYPTASPQESCAALNPKEVSSASNADSDWARKWAEDRHLVSRQRLQGSTNIARARSSFSLSQFRMLLAKYISLSNQLKSCTLCEKSTHLSAETRDVVLCEVAETANVNVSAETVDENRTESDAGYSSVDRATILARMKEIRSVIDDNDVLQSIQDRLKRASKKRMRLKRKRREQYEQQQEREQKLERMETEIAQWKNDVCVKEMDIKKEKEMKKAADEILSEVRRKLTEGRRSIKLLGHLRKLRDVRKEKALQKNNRIPKECDEIFEERVGALTDTMQKQIVMYEAEEQALEVMLDMEQEEDLVRERIARRKKERERLQQYEKQLNAFIFGEDDVPKPNDPLFPYRQFYDVALHSLAAFVRIRQDWDMFAVTNHSLGGSSVPLGWVVPVEPSSEIWASALPLTNYNI